jgi:hypothetical protein
VCSGWARSPFYSTASRLRTCSTRTRATALLALLLATPALAIYFYYAGRRSLGIWWRTFWTFALLAYLLHFWWAFVLTFGSDVEAVALRQSNLVAISNFAVTILWTLDVIAAQLGLRGKTVALLRLVTHVLVLVSFALATVVFREGFTFLAGAVALAVVTAALIARIAERGWRLGATWA